MAAIAADTSAHVHNVRNFSPLLHSILALIALTTATVLAVYKPPGITPFGVKRQAEK